MNQSTTWWSPLGHIFSYYHVRHFHTKLDPPGSFIITAFTLWFLMQLLERSNCTAYVRHLLERPQFLPTTDYAGTQVWQMISCCSFWWLSCIWAASGHIWTGRCVSTFKLPSLSSYSGFSQTTTRKESASLSHITCTYTYAPWFAARILYYSSLWLILVGLKCLSQGTISLVLFWIPD